MTYLLNMFTTDNVLIFALRDDKGWGARKMMSKFPGRNWKLSFLSRLIKKIDETGSLNRKVGSGRLRTVRTADSIAIVDEMICSQEDKQGTHKSPRDISREFHISHRSVQCIAKLDLHLKTFCRCEMQLLSHVPLFLRHPVHCIACTHHAHIHKHNCNNGHTSYTKLPRHIQKNTKH